MTETAYWNSYYKDFADWFLPRASSIDLSSQPSKELDKVSNDILQWHSKYRS
jgi:hypothetical protein